MSGAIGDKVGYVVLVQDRFQPHIWNETAGAPIATIGAAVGLVGAYERQQAGAEHQDTYAVAALELVMISRPDEAREGTK